MDMLLSIGGLLLAAIFTIVEKIAPEHARGTKRTLVSLTIVGFLVTACGAYLQYRHAQNQDLALGQLLDPNQGVLTNVNTRLTRIELDLQTLLPKPQAATAAAASPAVPSEQYFVQIAADTSRDRLQPYLDKLRSRFNVTTDFITILKPQGSNLYRLVFGQHLDSASAQKYRDVANTLGLPPPGQSAQIEKQPSSSAE